MWWWRAGLLSPPPLLRGRARPFLRRGHRGDWMGEWAGGLRKFPGGWIPSAPLLDTRQPRPWLQLQGRKDWRNYGKVERSAFGRDTKMPPPSLVPVLPSSTGSLPEQREEEGGLEVGLCRNAVDASSLFGLSEVTKHVHPAFLSPALLRRR